MSYPALTFAENLPKTEAIDGDWRGFLGSMTSPLKCPGFLPIIKLDMWQLSSKNLEQAGTDNRIDDGTPPR